MSYKVSLPSFEIFICFTLWISGSFVALYHIYVVGQGLSDYEKTRYPDFTAGWAWLGGLRDQADHEMAVWTALFVRLAPWLALHWLGAELCRRAAPAHLPLYYCVVSTAAAVSLFGPGLTLALLAQILSFAACHRLGGTLSLWVLAYAVQWLWRPERWTDPGPGDEYLYFVASMWTNLRCLSFCSEQAGDKSSSSSLLLLFSYTLYLPLLPGGPFISFEQFSAGLARPPSGSTASRLAASLLLFARVLFWYCFTQFALHYIYVNALLLRPYLVDDMTDWQLAGLGFAMGHLFHLKYVVLYGWSCGWASAEGFPTPPLPCCVSRVYLYSFVWRRFDAGLHLFLQSCLFRPLQAWLSRWLRPAPSRFLSSVIIFTFIYVWHREVDYVMWWTVFNFIGVTLEGVAKATCRLEPVHRLLGRLSGPMQRRLHCLAAAPLHYFSLMSNYYFIGNCMRVGQVYFDRFMYGPWSHRLLVLVILYGAGQSALTIQMWEERRLSARLRKEATAKAQ